MKTLSPHLILEKNLYSSHHPWLILIDVVIDESETIYLVRNTEDIVFNGHTYVAFPFEVSVIQHTTKGEIPSLNLKVSNVTRTIQTYLEDNDGLIGNEVTLRVVNSEYLVDAVDLTAYALLALTFQILNCSSDAQWVNFTLGVPNPMNKRFPLYRYIGDHCNFSYQGIECGYLGALTTCERTLTDCQTHQNSNRFGGYKGLIGGGIRVV